MSRVRIDQVGPHSIVGFSGHNVAGDSYIFDHRDELMSLVETHHCERLTIDLSNSPCISSSSIGVLFGLYKMGVHVELYRISPAVRDVLEVTRLDQIFPTTDTLDIKRN